MAYNVNDLSAYVAENKDALVKEVLFGGTKGDTIAHLTKQLGVKTTERLHVLNVAPEIQDGTGCGFEAAGETNITERDIKTAIFKVNSEWCPDDLLGKYAEYLVRLGANKNAEAMPFEAEIMDGVIAGINKEMEKKVWLGKNELEGFVTLADADQDTVKVALTAGSVYEAIKAVIMAIPEEIIDKAVVFVSPALYRAFVQEMVEKNYFHYVSGDVAEDDLVFPGTSIKVHKTMGLEGDKKTIYASAYDNMYYACDALNDKEELRAWFSDDDDLFRLKVKWNAGVQVAFPDLVVLGQSQSDLI